jgi:hypothetical protein
LIRDDDAKAEDFSLSLPRLSAYKRNHVVQTFVIPFWMDLTKNLGQEEFKPGQDVTQLLGICNARTVRQIG